MQGYKKFKDKARLVQCLFFLVAASMTLTISASHEKTEPSDGTVKSFKVIPSKAEVPKFTFFDQNMQPNNISTFKGKIVLLNIWATWCGPCLRELPALDRLQAKFDKSQFIILPISVDKEGVMITEPYYQKLGLKNLTFFHDQSRQMSTFFPLDVVPANFMIDRNGNLISFLRSFVDWDDQMAHDMIQHYVQQDDIGYPLDWSSE